MNLSGEQKERALKEIHHAGLRLERLSSKMLSFLGSYENDEIRFETIQVRELLQNALKDTKPIWEENRFKSSGMCRIFRSGPTGSFSFLFFIT